MKEMTFQVNCDDCCDSDLCNSNYTVQYYQVITIQRAHGNKISQILLINNHLIISFPREMNSQYRRAYYFWI